jgi:hypothetical protein
MVGFSNACTNILAILGFKFQPVDCASQISPCLSSAFLTDALEVSFFNLQQQVVDASCAVRTNSNI